MVTHDVSVLDWCTCSANTDSPYNHPYLHAYLIMQIFRESISRSNAGLDSFQRRKKEMKTKRSIGTYISLVLVYPHGPDGGVVWE
jgi:hypothetical protein